MTGLVRLALAGCLFVQASALAQTPPLPPERPRDAGAPTEPDKGKPETPPYELKLERLAELIGTLAFLRQLCAPGDGALWHTKMEDLLAAEGTDPARRDRLAGAFNKGFDSYRVSYRQCTPAASLVIERALGEGSQLAHELSARFGAS